jgi:hypothetical protein
VINLSKTINQQRESRDHDIMELVKSTGQEPEKIDYLHDYTEDFLLFTFEQTNHIELLRAMLKLEFAGEEGLSFSSVRLGLVNPHELGNFSSVWDVTAEAEYGITNKNSLEKTVLLPSVRSIAGKWPMSIVLRCHGGVRLAGRCYFEFTFQPAN